MSSPFFSHGVTLALVWFLGINAAVSAAVAVLVRLLGRREIDSPAFWLALRLLPAVTATLFVVALFVPSYWEYEPREVVEGFDLTLAALGAVGLGLIVASLARGAQAWRSVTRRTAEWMRYAHPLTIGRAALPAYAIEASRPMMALVGVLRPRLLVTRSVIETLTSAELTASVAHEVGHYRALDNLKRLLMRATPDCFTRPTAREIERRWSVAAERAADRAGSGDTADRCALASALVKVARLMPAVAMPAIEPISMLVTDSDIAARVHVLLNDTPPESRRRATIVRWLAVGLAIVPLVIAYTPLVRAVHEATEVLVHVV
jgi:Zn-dependent protease with chaperone function